MSLLLDALRRASASREDPKGEHYTLPRHGADEPVAPAPPERPDTAPHEIPGDLRGADFGGDLGDELALAPRDETQHLNVDRTVPEGAAPDEPAMAADSVQDDPAHETATRASARERATADALLEAGARGSRRGRAALVLGLSTAALIATAALAGGGWLWYQQSREQIATELGRYRPAAVPGETREPGNAEAGSLPALAEASATPGLEESAARASDESTNSSAAGEAAADESSPSSETAAPEGEPENAEPEPASESPDSTTRGGTNDARPAESADAPAGTSDASAGNGDPAAAEISGSTSGSAEPTAATANTTPPANPAEEARAGANAAENSDTAQPTQPSNDAAAQASTSASVSEPRRARPLIQVARGAPLSEALQIGYAALREDDLATAAPAYERALDLAPENRDALLGAAVLRQRQGAPDAARSLYQRVLDAHPRDPYARAALAALDGGATRRNESELKTLLREDPTAPALNFALGNLYAGESRWAEARQAYTRARDAAPEDPDYAYNLAVALDHLGRREAARAQYQQALQLADGARAEFQLGAVRRRVQQLR